MTYIKIEGGCVQNALTGVWTYYYEDTAGFHEVSFTASRRPKIGDTIQNGILVDAVLPQSNQDKSKWQTVDYQEWPDAK